MRILICVKEVPDSTTRVKVAPDGRSIDTGDVTWSISPYDEYAIELALSHKDLVADTVVSVITVGGAQAKDSLRRALAMGCDDATLLTSEGAEALGPLGVASALKSAVNELKPALVLCGKQASDDDQGFIGPALAEALGWPLVTSVTRFAPSAAGTEVWKETEGGHQVWMATGAAVLTVQKSEREPRYPTVRGIMMAKKKEVAECPAVVTADPVRIEIVKLEPPPARGGGKIFKNGDTKAHAAKLVALLRDEAKVL